MIFVTVGTERFAFDRLIRAADELKTELQGEPVFMQIGSATYTPSFPHERFIPFGEFYEKVREARLVISHAGAGTLLLCADLGKVPIMMARKQSLGEHIDDHQQMFARRMSDQGRLLLIDKPAELRKTFLHYEELCGSLQSGSNSVEPSLAQHLKKVLSEISKKNSLSDC